MLHADERDVPSEQQGQPVMVSDQGTQMDSPFVSSLDVATDAVTSADVATSSDPFVSSGLSPQPESSKIISPENISLDVSPGSHSSTLSPGLSSVLSEEGDSSDVVTVKERKERVKGGKKGLTKQVLRSACVSVEPCSQDENDTAMNFEDGSTDTDTMAIGPNITLNSQGQPLSQDVAPPSTSAHPYLTASHDVTRDITQNDVTGKIDIGLSADLTPVSIETLLGVREGEGEEKGSQLSEEEVVGAGVPVEEQIQAWQEVLQQLSPRSVQSLFQKLLLRCLSMFFFLCLCCVCCCCCAGVCFIYGVTVGQSLYNIAYRSRDTNA
jgi:hypothetical protein